MTIKQFIHLVRNRIMYLECAILRNGNTVQTRIDVLGCTAYERIQSPLLFLCSLQHYKAVICFANNNWLMGWKRWTRFGSTSSINQIHLKRGCNHSICLKIEFYAWMFLHIPYLMWNDYSLRTKSAKLFLMTGMC